MASAKVGDDVYGEDPTVNELEERAAHLMGKESALFAPSGTQSNLIAMLSHCTRGDEYIVGENAHTYRYEGGGAAVLGGIQPNPLKMGIDGRLDLDEIQNAIKPKDIHFARTRLVCLENTHAGHPVPPTYFASVKRLCNEYSLAMHLDGARIFNASVFQSIDPATLVEDFDSVSLCLSKGLGAPVGSILVGSRDFIQNSRRWRKVLGGGMRQAGIIAAAGLYALEHNIRRVSEDHEKAWVLAETLQNRFGLEKVRCQTNMLHLEIDEDLYTSLASHLASGGVKVGRPRWVLHKGITQTALAKIQRLISSFK